MELLFHELGINGYTLLAQIANFLILLFLLRKFLYKPLLIFLEKRKDIIEEGLLNAKKAKNELQSISKVKEEKIIEAEREANEIIENSKKTAAEKSGMILKETSEKAENYVREAKKIAEEEKKEAMHKLQKEIRELSVLYAEQILKKKIDEKENEEIINTYLNKLAGVS